MDNKVEWVDTKPLAIKKCSTIKLDQIQDYNVSAYYIKKILKKFNHKQRMKTLKFIGAIKKLVVKKHPRLILKATRKKLTRR